MVRRNERTSVGLCRSKQNGYPLPSRRRWSFPPHDFSLLSRECAQSAPKLRLPLPAIPLQTAPLRIFAPTVLPLRLARARSLPPAIARNRQSFYRRHARATLGEEESR